MIPTVVDYGARLFNPTIFMTTAAICAIVGMVTGSQDDRLNARRRVCRDVQGHGALQAAAAEL